MLQEKNRWGDLNMQHEVAIEAAKSSPAIGGTVYYYFTMNEWVGLITAIYVLAQLFILIHKYIWAIHDRKNQK